MIDDNICSSCLYNYMYIWTSVSSHPSQPLVSLAPQDVCWRPSSCCVHISSRASARSFKHSQLRTDSEVLFHLQPRRSALNVLTSWFKTGGESEQTVSVRGGGVVLCSSIVFTTEEERETGSSLLLLLLLWSNLYFPFQSSSVGAFLVLQDRIWRQR